MKRRIVWRLKKFSVFLVVLGIFLTLILLTGCSWKAKLAITGRQPIKQDAKNKLSEIMGCFMDKDREGIKSFFSGYIIEKYPEINEQIDNAFDFLDGEIITYDEPEEKVYGGINKREYDVRCFWVITDKGTEYTIGVKGWYRHNEMPEKIGARVIFVVDETKAKRPGHDMPSADVAAVIGETCLDIK